MPGDIGRIHEIRNGTAENRLNNPALVTAEEIAWYMTDAIFLVSEDADGLQGFTCVNHQTSHVWALFVIDGAQGRGHGTALHDAGMARLRRLGHRQVFLSTDPDSRAVGFYCSKGWRRMGLNKDGEAVLRLLL